MLSHYIGEICKRRVYSETHQLFSVQTTPHKLKKKDTITGHFKFLTRQGNHIITVTSNFSVCFPSTLKRKAGVFQFPRLEERFQN